MKKKLTIALLAVFIAPLAFAQSNWGVGVKLGAGENDPKTLQEIYDNIGGDLTKGYGIFGLEALYERTIQDQHKAGVKLGLDVYGDNEYEHRLISKITEETYAIPLTLYYKWDGGVKNWSFFAGAGATYMKAEMDDGTDSYSESKIFPHIAGGAEYRFTELFALGFDVKYNFNAKLEKHIEAIDYKTDRSGFSGALAARFYF